MKNADKRDFHPSGSTNIQISKSSHKRTKPSQDDARANYVRRKVELIVEARTEPFDYLETI